MLKNNVTNRRNIVAAVRRIFDDPTIKLGRRLDFERQGKKIITRAGDASTKVDMNYRSAYRGYDYTLNIKFEKDGLRANAVAHTQR